MPKLSSVRIEFTESSKHGEGPLLDQVINVSSLTAKMSSLPHYDIHVLLQHEITSLNVTMLRSCYYIDHNAGNLLCFSMPSSIKYRMAVARSISI